MQNNVNFSVVIPVHNRVELLKRALNSIQKQSLAPLEVIVIDDFSQEDIKSTVEKFNLLNIKYIRLKENLGGAQARNEGIILAKGTHIAFLDSDDYWLETKLEACFNAITSKTPILFHRTRIKKNSKDKNSNRFGNTPKKYNNVLNYLFEEDALLQTSTCIVKRDIATLNLFSPQMIKHQDLDFYFNINKFWYDTVFLEDILSVWDISHEEVSISRQEKIQFSLNWIENKKDQLSAEAYYAFICNAVFSKNPRYLTRDTMLTIQGLLTLKLKPMFFLKSLIKKFLIPIKKKRL